MPLAKDDAEVGCIPSKQHLPSKDRTSELHLLPRRGSERLGEGVMPHVHLAHMPVRRHIHAFMTHMLMALHFSFVDALNWKDDDITMIGLVRSGSQPSTMLGKLRISGAVRVSPTTLS